MRLSVIVIHHDAPECLRACLTSIAQAGQGLDIETFVVDNASREKPAEAPAGVTWIQNRENLGFGAAINQAAARAGGDVLLVLNADIELLPDCLQALKDFFLGPEAQSSGPVGGRLLFSDGSIQPSCGPFPTLAGLLWRRLLPAAARKYYLRPPAAGEVDWVTGAFLALRRPVFQELGGFDEGFFLYYEDVDLCLRARQKGCPAYYLPQAVAYHRHPLALRPAPEPRLRGVIRDSRLRYFTKHRPAWEAKTLASIS